MSTFVCDKCNKVVNPYRCWQKVEGWVKPRSAGGANQITLREPLHIYRHEACMTLERSRHEQAKLL